MYRFRDSTAALLYIGIAFDPFARARQHAAAKPWWHQVDPSRTTVEWHPNREVAEAAELLAIRQEVPRHNIITSDENGCARFLPRADGGAWGRPTWQPTEVQADILHKMAAATADRKRIEAEIRSVTAQLGQAFVESEVCGIPVSWMAEAANVTRKTVYRHLGKPMK